MKILTLNFVGIETFVSQDKINFSGFITKKPSSLQVCQITIFLKYLKTRPRIIIYHLIILILWAIGTNTYVDSKHHNFLVMSWQLFGSCWGILRTNESKALISA